MVSLIMPSLFGSPRRGKTAHWMALVRGSRRWMIFQAKLTNQKLPTVFVDVLYSREAGRQLTAGADSFEFLLNSSDLVPSRGDVTLRELLSGMGDSMSEGLRIGGNTIHLRQILEQVSKEIEGKALYSTELLFVWDEQLPILTQVADFMDERDPRELLFLRHMEDFFSLLCKHQGVIPSGSSFSLLSRFPSPFKRPDVVLIHSGKLSQIELGMLYGVFQLRETLLADFTERRLKRYLRLMEKLGLRTGLTAEELDELAQGLLIELEWFHEA
jgi:hypothetical protein